MSMDLTGINNRNEYYTNHYFASIFEENTRDTINRWRGRGKEVEGYRPPWSLLRDVGRKYFLLRERYSRLRNETQSQPLIKELADACLAALGYDNSGGKIVEVVPDIVLPIYLEITKANGAPLLWVVLCRTQEQDGDIMQGYPFLVGGPANENGTATNYDARAKGMINEDILSKVFYNINEPPRWIILFGMSQIALIDRSKWNEKRYLFFELDDIFGRREESTLQAMSVLLHCESLCPAEGLCLLDKLDENSHRHSSGVSQDLKYALRECIELLGNEVIYDKRTRLREEYFGKEFAHELSIECLRYMYRILFLLFIEARPELEYAPMKSNTYVRGYSLEGLRDLVDNIREDNEQAGEGYYLHETLSKLFDLIYQGYPANRSQLEKITERSSLHEVFLINPLKAHIFDPDYTPHLSRAKIRNSVMLQIIDLMSVSRPGNARQRRGRISYSSLGINQLGAVYEALLSYRGFLAEETLFEVKRARDTFNELDVGYFVPERELPNYTEEERVRYQDGPKKGKLRSYEKGTFIYRLAGREREKSASYYTPEVLTQCLVKYALKELLENKTADEILELTICEPAMGSAAFLNEAINQLAEVYLTKKQKETGESIPHDKRLEELQRVKMYIADRNVYGIDLNPIAVELAEVSLWLNTIYKGAYVPWFGTQLVCGNSLIGARRQVYTVEQVKASREPGIWYANAPERIMPGAKRKTNKQIYHFLLGDPGMVNYTDKVIKTLAKGDIDKIKKWNKKFISPHSPEDVQNLLRLSAVIDDLWNRQVELRREIKRKTADPLTVYGQPEDKDHGYTTIREKDSIYRHIYKSEEMENAGPYARLKAAMDYWCALWFWPIDKAELLPTRQEFLFDMSLILEGGVVSVRPNGQLSMFVDDLHTEILKKYADLPNVNLDILRQTNPRLQLAKEIADRYQFLHWELEFADLFEERGGFDLILGNPPWIKLEWDEKDVLSEFDPQIIIKGYTASQTETLRNNMLKSNRILMTYFSEYCETAAQQNFFGANQNYSTLNGSANLYKCFLPQAWTFTSKRGVFSFLHQEGVFEDSNGQKLRQQLYPRLRKHFQFENQKKYFDIGNTRKYSINVYCNQPTGYFETISDIYSVETIDQCYADTDETKIVGLKNENGDWETRGYLSRILKIGEKELKMFASIFDDEVSAYEARLPRILLRQLLKILMCFVEKNNTLGNLEGIYTSPMWDEAGMQKQSIIKRKTCFEDSLISTVYSSPHIGVANPLFQTPKRECNTHRAYECIDLTCISSNYLPRTNYVIGCRIEDYNSKIPTITSGKKYTSYYRVASRRRLSQSGERTLIASIIPPDVGHIDSVFGIRCDDFVALVAGLMASIPFDFFIRATGKADGRFDVLSKLPVFHTKETELIEVRSLMLNCLTEHYALLWKESFKSSFIVDTWAKDDKRLKLEKYSSLKTEWTWDTPLRTDYERRQALVEIDVLTAMVLGMTLGQLKTIYRTQFPVLQQYENDTWYDQNGRIVFSEKSMGDLTYKRSEWEEIRNAKNGIFKRTIIDDTTPDGPIERTIEYVAPFDRCDREQDYETVWANFTKRFAKE